MFEQAISAMASVMVDPYLLGLIFATTVLGVIIGVLPGLGATTGATDQKKPFNKLRQETKLVRLGNNGKTDTGQKAAVIDLEPSARPI